MRLFSDHSAAICGTMTTIRQLIQSSPAKANELFAKLVDTSESAVKTREKLFSELKDEFEHLANLEEQHLFPVLRKHKDLRGFRQRGNQRQQSDPEASERA